MKVEPAPQCVLDNAWACFNNRSLVSFHGYFVRERERELWSQRNLKINFINVKTLRNWIFTIPYIYIYIIIFFLIVRAQGRRPVRKWRRIIACRNVVYSQIQVSSVACFSRIEAGRIPSAIERCGGVGLPRPPGSRGNCAAHSWPWTPFGFPLCGIYYGIKAARVSNQMSGRRFLAPRKNLPPRIVPRIVFHPTIARRG